MKVLTVEEYVIYLESLTTKEFCKLHDIPVPTFTGDVKTTVSGFLQIDSLKYRLIREYAFSRKG